MTETPRPASTPKHHVLSRRSVLVAAGAALIGGMGCATVMTLSDSNDKVVRKAGPVVLQDTVLAIARPDAKLAATLELPNTLAFIGQQHTYLLTAGGDRLFALARQLEASRLHLAADQPDLFLRDGVVWGHVILTYTPAQTEGDAAQLTALGFMRTGEPANPWRLRQPVQGKILPAVSMTAVSPLQSFQRERTLTFHAPPTEERTPNLGKFAMLPLALVVDVVTAPLQLLGVGILGLAIATH